MSILPQKCPSCSSPLKVTQLTCVSCGTGVVGSFDFSPFLRLSPENLRFLEAFVRNRGNIKEMARETGESYWAIRRQLDRVIQEMGFEPDQLSQADLSTRRQEILQQLSQGEISVAEAKKLLVELGKGEL
jgi:hypothetical protein